MSGDNLLDPLVGHDEYQRNRISKDEYHTRTANQELPSERRIREDTQRHANQATKKED